jgi:hypothetical protein
MQLMRLSANVSCIKYMVLICVTLYPSAGTTTLLYSVWYLLQIIAWLFFFIFISLSYIY